MELPQKRNSAREIYLGNGSEIFQADDGSFKVVDLSQVLLDESNRNI